MGQLNLSINDKPTIIICPATPRGAIEALEQWLPDGQNAQLRGHWAEMAIVDVTVPDRRSWICETTDYEAGRVLMRPSDRLPSYLTVEAVKWSRQSGLWEAQLG